MKQEKLRKYGEFSKLGVILFPCKWNIYIDVTLMIIWCVVSRRNITSEYIGGCHFKAWKINSTNGNDNGATAAYTYRIKRRFYAYRIDENNHSHYILVRQIYSKNVKNVCN